MRLRRFRTPLVVAATVCALAGALAAPAHAQAKLYKWVDDKGVTHYSDKPAQGASKVDVPAAQSYRAPPPSATASRAQPAAAPKPAYERIEIVSPANDEAFVNVDGPIDLTADLQPGLASGHRTWWVLDGKRIDDVAPDATAITRSFERGTHTARLEVTDEGGNRVAESALVTFHLRFNSIAQPPVGPSLKPAPSPQPKPTPTPRGPKP